MTEPASPQTEARRCRLLEPLQLEIADWSELPRPWTIEWPWFRLLTIGNQARDEIRLNQRELGDRFWDEVWDGRDAKQGSIRVRTTGAWPWAPAKVAELRDQQPKPAARMKVVVGKQG